MGLFRREQTEDPIGRFKDLIEKSHSIVAITGAGISVSAGGVTYGQLMRNLRFGFGGLPSSDSGYESFLQKYRRNMFQYEPSLAHRALRDLETEGKLTGIITTNEDCMHTIAGSKNVAEIQGSFQINRCRNCGKHYDGYEIWKQEEIPRCEACGGIILPYQLYSNIGLWEEDVAKARTWISEADLIIVIGTNGYFGSAYWDWRRRDAKIVQINPGHTHFDSIADLNIRQGSDEAFAALAERRRQNG